MRIVYMGTPEFAVPPLVKLVQNQYEVVAVYTRPDKPAGRGRVLLPPPQKREADRLGLPVVQPDSLKDSAALAQLAGFRPDVIVVAAYGKILPESVLKLPPYGCINIHPSLLPAHRGASPVAAAILAGDVFTGVSIMLMDAGLDSGPVLVRAQVPISDTDTTGSLTAKLSVIASYLLQDVLMRWSRGEMVPRPQDEAESTYSGPILKSAGDIDWRLPAVDIWRRVRAFQPWPGSYTNWGERQLKIIEAVPLDNEDNFITGEVVELSPDAYTGASRFGVKTGDGILAVLNVQLAGKKAISAAEFLRGQRQFIGTVLT